MIKKILVANRGEIAIRVMRSCREMEITSIAIFSEADRTAKHVLYADEAYCVGPAASKESYLNIEKIIEVAKECHADAIHPGYGFLSENATFARRCQEENIIFIPFRNRNKPKGYFPLKRHTREGFVVSILRGKLPGCSKYIYIFHWRTI